MKIVCCWTKMTQKEETEDTPFNCHSDCPLILTLNEKKEYIKLGGAF